MLLEMGTPPYRRWQAQPSEMVKHAQAAMNSYGGSMRWPLTVDVDIRVMYRNGSTGLDAKGDSWKWCIGSMHTHNLLS